MQKFLLLFLLIFSICFTETFSQPGRQLNTDPLAFTGELTGFMGRNLTEQQTAELDRFISQWDSTAYNPSEMEVIINTVNLLIARNARPVPHMLDFLNMHNAFRENDPDHRHYRIWNEAFMDILNNRGLSIQQISDLMKRIDRLVSRNILQASNAVNWEASSPRYSLVYDDSLRIVFPETDLMGYNHIDTLTIYRTSGIYCPITLTWKGSNGRVTWERAGLDARDTYATLGDYIIDLSRSEYNADAALLHLNRYFQLPVTGRLSDRVMTTRNRDQAGYPGFISYRQEFIIRDIYSNIDYQGGLSMQGAKLIGSGGEEGNARLIFYREGEIFLRAESKHFVFSPQRVSSMNSSIVFYLDNDSLFHPNLQLNYVDNTRELSLNQNNNVVSRSPWDNQYHRVDMTFAQLLWGIDEEEMKLTMPRASSIGNASFRSFGFFDRSHYQQLQGMDLNHPLLSLRNMANFFGADEFPAGEYARYLRMPLPGVRHQLLDLTLGGFIFYDTQTDLIRLRQKLYDYLDAFTRRIDYDVIDFASTTRAPLENALLNLDTRDLKINGIPQVHISNSQNVNLFPANNTVILKENRNFIFDGTVNAGLLSFFGTNFAFDYDKFAVSLQNVDSLSMRVRVEASDDLGRARLAGVRNLIRSVTGELLVDEPLNKSGRVENPEYPKFISNENSYVFYDQPYIQNGAYGQEEFYFILYPFVMDSLNVFRDTEIRFNGRLVSAGIFPEIEEMLTLQKDYSLGISHKLPDGGLPAYGGKGRFYHDIELSNDGLKGSGRLDYLAAKIYSEDFLFLPETMSTRANDFEVSRQEAGAEFPSLTSQSNSIQWFPERDLMTVGQGEKGFSVFDGQAELNGSLEITPSGLSGAGSLLIGNAEISSDRYVFMSGSLKAGSSDFVFKDQRNPVASLSGGPMESFIDMDTRTGEFTMTPASSRLSLPDLGYTVDPESFTWDMENREFVLVSSATDPETGRKGAGYISTKHRQDSIRFFSPHTVIDYESQLLTADEVTFLEIADAMIFPPDEKITIDAADGIHPLQDARIIAGRGTVSHEIYGAELKIISGNDYTGWGNYDYIDEMNETQKIRFSHISVAGKSETIARGSLEKEDDFLLSPAFGFSGETEMKASRPHLNFRGATRIIHDCYGLSDRWLNFENEIDPLNVLIPVPAQPLSADFKRIYSGIFVANDSIHVYPAFFSERRNYADQLIIGAEGYIKFDPLAGEYRIASAEKLLNPSHPGNHLSLNPEECIIRGEGNLELGISLGQFEIKAFGSATNKVNTNETRIEGILSLDFLFSDEALALIARDADSLPGRLADSTTYWSGLEDLLGTERAHQFRASSSVDGRQNRLPSELQKTFVLSHVDLEWNKESRSYVSRGKIGIGYINGVEIEKSFNGYLEITKRRSGDYLDLYLEMDDDCWYYFGYTRGVMQAFSSNREFVTILDNLPLRQRRDRSAQGTERYIYMLATDTKIEQFFRTYRQNTALNPEYEHGSEENVSDEKTQEPVGEHIIEEGGHPDGEYIIEEGGQ